ncbi:DUF4007 family protein [Aestuariispira insulae]|uniref:Uncharacterized protein DUF4007 n=1 Tax=Aestuariispira insulae TaxID=1461337 RepID=A0A3D9H687_9PROT|nr:DUF4007 family protein [Aestuariispira insulae]RED45018.1 uncharacterized protein DUF4007 [Aestuariispira insulae]
MPRGPIYLDSYKPQFSGHETFPLRYGWLKKAYDAVNERKGVSDSKTVFTRDDAIARFGVGKNMVSSMRHWATASDIIMDGEAANALVTTALGDRLFGAEGFDPYMEHPASLWMIHWKLAGRPDKTTWYWSFNNFPGATFERERLVKGLEKVAKDCAWPRVSATTIRRDVECFLRTYVARQSSASASPEDTLESPLAELGLIKAVGKRDGFRFVRGPKSTLRSGIFLYALIDFWKDYTSAQTLSFEAIAHEPGSPGRVFLLDENDVADRLLGLEEFTDGAFRWSETAGLKQVLRDAALDLDAALEYVARDYERIKNKEAA